MMGGDMNLCNNNHDEVCFEGRFCPVCELQKDFDSVLEEKNNLKDEIKDLENQVSDLEAT